MNKNRKSASKLIIILLVGFTLVFSGFIYLITRPSELETALRNLTSCSSVEELESLWKLHPGLHDTSLANPIRNRAHQLSPDSIQLMRLCQFLPPRPKYFNLIIVPDLSRRLTDSINNPEQIKSDKKILYKIYSEFKNKIKFEGRTKDRLIVDLTDRGQAGGQFRNIADSLIFDPFSASKEANRKFFENKSGFFERYIDSLYSLAITKPLGADYYTYFNRKLENHLIKSNIYEEYKNLVIIITDGYLEAEDKLYTGKGWQLAKICQEIKSGVPIKVSIDSAKLWIPVLPQNFSDVEVYLFEVNERKSGANCDYDILKTQWTAWLSSMGVCNLSQPFFFQREDASTHVTNKIKEILNR